MSKVSVHNLSCFIKAELQVNFNMNMISRTRLDPPLSAKVYITDTETVVLF